MSDRFHRLWLVVLARSFLFGIFVFLAVARVTAQEVIQQAPLGVRDVPATERLNLREWANSRTSTVLEIPHDAVGLMPTGRTHRSGADSWIEVTYQGRKGWVNSRYVGPMKNESPPAPKGSLFADGDLLQVEGAAKDDKLNMRVEPNARSAVLLELPGKTSGMIASGDSQRNGDVVWIKVKYSGKVGWVNARFVKPVKRDAATAPATTAAIMPAAQPENPVADCDSDNADLRVRGCTILVDRSGLASSTLAIALGRRSDAYLARKEYGRAIADRSEAMKLEPTREEHKQRLAETYRLQAMDRQDHKDAVGAIKDYGEAIRVDPTDIKALAARAALYINRNETDSAISDLTAAHDLQPGERTFSALLVGIYLQRGSSAILQKHYDSAIADLTKAANLDASNATVFLRRGAARAAKGDGAALADLAEAIRLNPNLTDAYFRRAHLLIAKSSYREGVADLDEVLRIDPANQGALLGRAYALEQMGEDIRASADYRKVLAAEPGHTEAQGAVKRLEKKEALEQALLAPRVDDVAAASDAPSATYWNHNGSTMKLVANGSRRRFYYEEPRSAVRDSGASPGTLLFDGARSGGTYSGTARIFSSRCGAVRYKVSGAVGADERSVMLVGQAPQLGESCGVVGYRNDTLIFNLIQAQE